MRRAFLVLTVLLGVALLHWACGKKESPTTPGSPSGGTPSTTYNGNWVGTTSQGYPCGAVVRSNYFKTLYYVVDSSCGNGNVGTFTVNVPVSGDTFSSGPITTTVSTATVVYQFGGTFTSATQVSGAVTVMQDGCGGSITFTFMSTLNTCPVYNASATIGSGYFQGPTGIRYAAGGYLWVVDGENNNLQKWATAGGSPVTTVSSFNAGAAFNIPWGTGVDPSTGNVYVGDQYNCQVEVFSSAASYLSAFGSAQFTGGTNCDAEGAAVNSAGTTVYTLDFENSAVYAYLIGGTAANPTFTYQFTFGNSGTGTLAQPYNLCLDGPGNVYVTDTNHDRIVVFDPTGNYLKALTGDDLMNPTDVAVDASGNVFVTDDLFAWIVVFNASGAETGAIGWNAGLTEPDAIALDSSGNIYVGDYSNHQIVVFRKQ